MAGGRGGHSRLVRCEQAFAVGDAEEEPEPGEVLAQRVGAVGGAADEAGQGSGEVVAVGFQPAAEELQQFGKLDGVPEPMMLMVVMMNVPPSCAGQLAVMVLPA